MDEQTTQDLSVQSDEALLNDQMAVRRAKLERLIQEGRNPYELGIVPTHTARQVVEAFDRWNGEQVALAGRLRAMRIHGGATFADLHDSSGRIQLFVRLDAVGQQAYEAFKDLDLGDIIGVRGVVFRTKRG
ncbi:MAG: OB-fold nucleic acid binding domain-containing protein, partial [Clostridia bacterium]